MIERVLQWNHSSKNKIKYEIKIMIFQFDSFNLKIILEDFKTEKKCDN